MIEIKGLHDGILLIPYLVLSKGSTAIIGPNASGKTTFLELCAGLRSPQEGTITIDRMPPSTLDIGWVDEFPDRTLLFNNVFEEIAAPLRFRFIPCGNIAEMVIKIAKRLGIKHLLPRPTIDLSAGEKTLVSLAAAIIASPIALILDEFDSHLDLASRVNAESIIQSSSSRYILFCTQQMDAAAQADTVIYLNSGRVAYQGRPNEVFSSLKNSCFYPFMWRLTGCN